MLLSVALYELYMVKCISVSLHFFHLCRVSLEKIFSNCEDLDTVSILLGSESDRINRLAKNGNANISDTSQWIELLGWNDSPMQIGVRSDYSSIYMYTYYPLNI